MSEHSFTDADGVEVFYRSWPLDGAKATVVIAHGMSEHSGRYDRFARALNDAGYAAYALDHRGHGRTGDGTGAGRLGAGAPDALVEDLHRLVEIAAGDGRAVVVFGHSMGSMITQAYVTRHGDAVAAYVLSGCPGVMEGGAETAAALEAAVQGGMGDEPADLLGGIGDAGGRTKYDWLSRDEAEVDKYIADAYCGDSNPMTYGVLAALFGLVGPSMEAEAIASIPAALPVLLITGSDDPVATGTRDLEQRLRDRGLAVTSHWYEGARHEVLNETNRDEITADVARWLDGVTGG